MEVHVVQGKEEVWGLFPIFTMGNTIGSPTVKCFLFVCENLTTFPFDKRIVGKLDSWAFLAIYSVARSTLGFMKNEQKVWTIARRQNKRTQQSCGRNTHSWMNATAHWPTAHGPDCASATHAGRSPPIPTGRHSQRRGPFPKLLWADQSCFLQLTILCCYFIRGMTIKMRTLKVFVCRLGYDESI